MKYRKFKDYFTKNHLYQISCFTEYFARTKGGVDGERIRTDSRFERTRENGREFQRAVKAGKLLRDAFSEHVFLTTDRGIRGQLTSALSRVVKSDQESIRGERNVMNGERP